MNKYVLRTSLVWMTLAVGAGAWYWHIARTNKPGSNAHSRVQPVAVGTARPEESGAGTPDEAPLAPVQLTPERMQSIGVATGEVEERNIADHIRATGTVEVDERLLSSVQVRFSGYIHDVFASATYQPVHKGDPLFTIYSPELVATENEYLLALRNRNLLSGSSVDGVASGAASLASAAEARLRQWNVPERDIAAVKATGKPIQDMRINSPVSGYITERNALPNLYVEPATRLYTIADLSRVWVYAQIFQDDVGSVTPTGPVQITADAYPGRVFRGRIESILPQVDLATRTVRVRIEIRNADLKLRPGMFVNVNLKSSLGRQLVVPASAVLQSGTRELAFLDLGGGRLQPQEVTTGPRAGDDIVILSGLHAGQRIVTSANFLIDSESQLQAAAGSYTPPPPGVSGAAPQPSQGAPVNIKFATDPTPPRKGNNTIHVKLSGPDSAPVTGAAVSATFYMPAMPAMGMAAMTAAAKVQNSSGGEYRGTVVLPSGGPWQVTISVQKDGKTLATKQLRVNATGGM